VAFILNLKINKPSYPTFTRATIQRTLLILLFFRKLDRCLKSLKLVRAKDKEVPHVLYCRYVLSKLVYDEMFTGKIVLSEKVTFLLFGNVILHNVIAHGSNKPHSDIARTHIGQFDVTVCFVFCPSGIIMVSL